MPDTNLEVLQDAAQDRFHLDLNGALRVATGINLDAEGISQALFQGSVNQNQTGLLSLLSGGLVLDNQATSYAETSDKAALDILGDIDMRVEFAFISSVFTAQSLMAKWTPAAQQSYRLVYIPALAMMQLINSTTGANSVTGGQLAGTYPRVGAVRSTLDVDNLAAGRTARFYTAPNLDGPWTELAGSPVVTAGVTSIFNSTAVLRLGATGTGTEPFGGRIHRAELRNGIDGAVVANPDFRNLAPGTTSFADAAGNTWNLGATARVV